MSDGLGVQNAERETLAWRRVQRAVRVLIVGVKGHVGDLPRENRLILAWPTECFRSDRTRTGGQRWVTVDVTWADGRDEFARGRRRAVAADGQTWMTRFVAHADVQEADVVVRRRFEQRIGRLRKTKAVLGHVAGLARLGHFDEHPIG